MRYSATWIGDDKSRKHITTVGGIVMTDEAVARRLNELQTFRDAVLDANRELIEKSGILDRTETTVVPLPAEEAEVLRLVNERVK